MEVKSHNIFQRDGFQSLKKNDASIIRRFFSNLAIFLELRAFTRSDRILFTGESNRQLVTESMDYEYTCNYSYYDSSTAYIIYERSTYRVSDKTKRFFAHKFVHDE